MATDILMMMSLVENKPIEAESRVTLDRTDVLTKDFKAGCYFEIDGFNFSIKLSDKDPSKNDSFSKNTDYSTGGFEKFKFLTGSKMFANTYPVKIEAVSFSRQIDKSSPILWKNCFNRISFKSAAIVKRKDMGGTSIIQSLPFFRLDFQDIMIINMDFSVSDNVIKEEVKFICRSATAQYLPQLADGSAGSVISSTPLTLVKAS